MTNKTLDLIPTQKSDTYIYTPIKPSNPFIWSKEKALSKTFCKRLITKFKKDEKKYQGQIGNGRVDKKMKDSMDTFISGRETWEEEDEVLFQSLADSTEPYIEHLTKALDLECFEKLGNIITDISPYLTGDHHDTGYQIQETVPGGYYDWHHDARLDQTQDYGACTRVFTYIWYLNDNFDEGETEFYDGTLVEPETGKLVIFPATWTFYHRGRTPVGGNKYICTGWILSSQV